MTRSAEISPPAGTDLPTGTIPRRGQRLRRALIHCFVGLHLAAVIGWSFSFPNSAAPLGRVVRSRLAFYMVPALLAQQWDMFANPPLSNKYLEAEVTFADGGHGTWRFPRLDEGGYFQRYCNERYRKWATESVMEAAGRPLPLVAEAAARYAARQVERPGNAARKVELVRYRAQIPPPRRGAMRPYAEAPRDWERQVLYACEFDSAGRTTRAWPATRPGGTGPSTQPAATQPGLPPPTETEVLTEPDAENGPRDGGPR
jgi:hypothetical protein